MAKTYKVVEVVQSPDNEPAEIHWGQGDALHVIIAVSQILNHERNRDENLPIEVKTLSINITKVPVE